MRLNDYDTSTRWTARVLTNAPLTGADAPVEVRELELEVGDPGFGIHAGSSIGVLVPGPHPFGQPFHLRLYSVADTPEQYPSGGVRFPIAVRRCSVIDPYSGERHDGIASNYLCDRAVGDEITLCGPYGLPFPVPPEPEAHLVLIGMGTGIAPFRALVRSLHEQHPDWPGRITLFHGGRTGLELLYRNNIRDDFARYYDRPTFEAIEALASRPHWSDRIAWDLAIGARAAEITSWLDDPKTYVYIAGLVSVKVDLEAAFRRIAPSPEAWARRKAELVAGGRWVELLY